MAVGLTALAKHLRNQRDERPTKKRLSPFSPLLLLHNPLLQLGDILVLVPEMSLSLCQLSLPVNTLLQLLYNIIMSSGEILLFSCEIIEQGTQELAHRTADKLHHGSGDGI